MGLYGQGDAPGSAGDGGPVITAQRKDTWLGTVSLPEVGSAGVGRRAALISSGWQGCGGVAGFVNDHSQPPGAERS